jgi:Ca2+-transporting ATPase
MSSAAVHIHPDGPVRLRSSLPGRHRVWIAGLYHNPTLEQALERGLRERGQKAVRANLVTATLLVRTEERLGAAALIEQIVAVLDEFSMGTGTSRDQLERRGRTRPVYLARNARTRQRGPVASADGASAQPAASDSFLADDVDAPSSSVRDIRTPNGSNVKAWRNGLLEKHSPFRRSLHGREHGESEPDRGEEQQHRHWHTLEIAQLSEMWRVDTARGLGVSDAAQRLAQYQRNELPEAEFRSGLAMFFDQFKQLPVALLAGSALLSCATGGVIDGIVILGVIALNGVIGFVTESSAERTIASLSREGALEADVVRAGQSLRIPLGEVVPGDIIQLRMGSVVPADARLLEASDLSIDESALTGESLPVTKAVRTIGDVDLPLGERTNMVYRTTLVTGGSGRALVVATGVATEVGKLQSMLGEVKHPETPMQRQLRELGERSMVIAGVVCGGVFVVGLLRGHGLLQMLRTAVSLAVAAVPEGLPTVAITTLAIGIQRMKQRQVIVRRLDAIETLGAVQVLCFDKTGTITYNRMCVVRVVAGEVDLAIANGKIRMGERELRPEPGGELDRLLAVGALCSEVQVARDGQGGFNCEGSPTEKALVQLALEQGYDIERLRAEHPRQSVVERTEQRRLMATIHRSASGAYLVAVKGSPEDVLERCRHALREGQVVPLSDADRSAIRRQNDALSSDALRVLAFAYCEHPERPDCFEEELIWLGLAGLADPPREGLRELIARFRMAGVRCVMITGDQSATAYAVAKQIGLDVDGELQTLDAVDLDQMDPDVLGELVPETQVFSRVSPRQKLRIVQALQARGLVVAMTGDGVNDCPALKAADIGVAMGGGKSPVAREVADMILETDDLHAMLVAIEQGRVIHADIKKAVRFILATNLSEILLTFLSVAAGFGEGMSPLQLLWINLVSDIFPELALALQPSEDDVLQRPPRERGAKMFSSEEYRHMAMEGGVLTLGALAAYSYAIRRYGLSPRAKSIAFLTLTSAQLLHAFSTRSERHHIFDSHQSAPNPYLPLSVGGGIALTLLIQLVPATRKLFGSRPLPAMDWLITSLGAALPLIANEMTKAMRFSAVRPLLPAGAWRPPPTSFRPTLLRNPVS